MLIKDLEQNIYAIGGRRVEYTELVKNEEQYWLCRLPCYSLERDFTDVLLKDYSPAEFFNFNTDIEVAEEWSYLFYHIPIEKTVEEEKREIELKENRFKEILVCCMTDDGENIIEKCVFYPEYCDKERTHKIQNAIFENKTKIQATEQNITCLGGRKLDFKEILKNIGDFIYYYISRSSHFYCKNGLERLRELTDKGLIYYLSNTDFLTTYNFQFYHIPYKTEYKKQDDDFISKNRFKLWGFEKDFIGVKEILVVTGTHDNKSLEYFNIFFPFDMLEEKQKEIKEFIFNNKP